MKGRIKGAVEIRTDEGGGERTWGVRWDLLEDKLTSKTAGGGSWGVGEEIGGLLEGEG